MISVLISLGVLLALFAAATLLGFRLAHSARPYPRVLLFPHLALFALIAVGIAVCMGKIEPVLGASSQAIVALCFAGPGLIALLVTGVVMLWSKRKPRRWIFAHKLSMYYLGLTFVAAGVLAACKR